MNTLPRTLLFRKLEQVAEQPDVHHLYAESLCYQQTVIKTSEKPFSNCPRLEFYKILVPEKYRKKLQRIAVMSNDPNSDVIYEADDDYSEEDGLRLRGPRIPPEAHDPVELRFFIDGEEDDDYIGVSLGDPAQDVVLCLNYETIEDFESKIKGKVFFGVYSESVQAHIKLTLPPGFPICGGRISATTYGDESTERILLCSNTFHSDNGDLCLDRSVLAMPLGSYLHLRFVIFIADNDGIEITYKSAAMIEVPEYAAEISGDCILELIVPYEERSQKRARIADSSNLEVRHIQFKVQFESPCWFEMKKLKRAQMKRQVEAQMKGQAEAGGGQSAMDK